MHGNSVIGSEQTEDVGRPKAAGSVSIKRALNGLGPKSRRKGQETV